MKISRWFFRWIQWEDKGHDRLSLVPTRYTVQGAHLVRDAELIAIILTPEFWQYGSSNLTRTALKAVLARQIALLPIPMGSSRQPTAMVWTKDGDLFDWPARTLEQDEAIEEAEAAWGWIMHFCRKTKTEQKSASYLESKQEFSAWLPTAPKIL